LLRDARVIDRVAGNATRFYCKVAPPRVTPQLVGGCQIYGVRSRFRGCAEVDNCAAGDHPQPARPLPARSLTGERKVIEMVAAVAAPAVDVVVGIGPHGWTTFHPRHAVVATTHTSAKDYGGRFHATIVGRHGTTFRAYGAWGCQLRG
jgi:hypothetical protein